jgi:hypothetical protein
MLDLFNLLDNRLDIVQTLLWFSRALLSAFKVERR